MTETRLTKSNRLPLYWVGVLWLVLYLMQGMVNAWAAESHPAAANSLPDQAFLPLAPDKASGQKGKVYHQPGKYFLLKPKRELSLRMPARNRTSAITTPKQVAMVSPFDTPDNPNRTHDSKKTELADAKPTVPPTSMFPGEDGQVAKEPRPKNFRAAAASILKPQPLKGSTMQTPQPQVVKTEAKSKKDKKERPLEASDHQAVLAIFTPDMPDERRAVRSSRAAKTPEAVTAEQAAPLAPLPEKPVAPASPVSSKSKVAPTFILPDGKVLALNDEK